MINHPNRGAKKAQAGTKKGLTPDAFMKKRLKEVASYSHSDHVRDYSQLTESVKLSYQSIGAGEVLFQTSAKGLWDAYLSGLGAQRQVHNCNCCKRFIETYGGLAVVNTFGQLVPLFWQDRPEAEFYHLSFEKMRNLIRKAEIEGVFQTSQKVLGVPRTGEWTHLSVSVLKGHQIQSRLFDSNQLLARSRESVKTIKLALAEFGPKLLDEALRVLAADHLFRSDKFIAPLQFLRSLHNRQKGRAGEALLWKAVANAPEGFLHPRGSITGSLLEDIEAGYGFEDLRRRFNAKLAPLAYQRPEAPPKAQNIDQAEEVIRKLGLERSLERRLAEKTDLILDWEPVPATPIWGRSPAGVFSHLKPRLPDPRLSLPPIRMTWEKWKRTVLPTAVQVQLRAPLFGRFLGLTTALHADAPPIIKWDREEARNPVAWYVYPMGSGAQQWGLVPNAWVEVEGICRFPNLWGPRPMPYIAEGDVLLLAGAWDSGAAKCGNALFPEILREELHGIRATIEAFSKKAELVGCRMSMPIVTPACGYDLRKNSADCQLQVLTSGAWQIYNIDRWD